MTTSERQKLILDYLPLANKLDWIKNEKTPKSVTIDDLQSAAYFGLVDAASRYQRHYGVTFGAFARLRIYGEMADYLRELAWGGRRLVKMNSLGDGFWEETVPSVDKNDPLEFFEMVTRSLTGIGERIIKMYYMEQRTLREIGQVENLSESRISQLLSKCRDTIRREYNNVQLREAI